VELDFPTSLPIFFGRFDLPPSPPFSFLLPRFFRLFVVDASRRCLLLNSGLHAHAVQLTIG
jgi:hypothetical protein